MTNSEGPTRPVSLALSALLTLAAGVFFLVMGVGALSAGHGGFGVGVAAVLAVWGLFVMGAGASLWRGRRWARGPVVACGLLHAASCAGFAGSQPWAWVGVVVAALTVAGAVWPDTTRALRLR